MKRRKEEMIPAVVNSESAPIFNDLLEEAIYSIFQHLPPIVTLI